MRAGRLRHRVQIQRATETRASDGGTVQTWRAIGTVWADVRPLTGREQELAGRTASVVSHRVEVRYRDGVDTRCRVVWGDRTFGVVAARNEDERGRALVMDCLEAL